MADEPVVPAEQPVVAAVEAPVVDAPVVEQPVVAAEAPVVEAPVVEAPVVEARADLLKDAQPEGVKAEEKPVEVKAEEPVKEAEKPVEAKPEEKPVEAPVEADKPVEAKPEEAPPAELPKVDYKFELPETITMDDARKGQFIEAMDAARTGDAQKLIGLYQEGMTEFAKQVDQHQRDVWGETLDRWRTESMADPVIGGAGHQTAMQSIAMVRNRFMSDHAQGSDGWKSDAAAFNHMLDSTGVGNHPVMLRFLHRISGFANEPAVPNHGDVKLVADGGGKSGNPLHDNPRSRQLNGRQ